MLVAEKLYKCYGSTVALHALDLSVAPGELYALLGPNGAGKTTTINCFLGFIAPDGGRVTIDGLEVAHHPLETKQRLAYIPEQVNLYGHFSALENLSYFAQLGGHRCPPAELRNILAEVGLQPEAHDRRISGFSKGMRQKVGIAIAMAKRAKALLLDEPTSGLDPSASHEFSQLLAGLRGRGVAILMATHDLFRAKEDATRVGIMRQGALVRELSADEIRGTDLERLYLEAMRA